MDPQANQEEGAVLELMVPEVCLESLGRRVTVVSMACLVCQGTRVTGVTREELDLWDHRERTERGETMETLDPGGSQVNQALVVCWGLKVLMESPDPLVYVEMTDPMVLKETWVLKESRALQVSREPQELRECLVPRERTALQERRVLRGSQVYQGCPELTDLLVTQERRDLQGPRETRAPMALRELSAIPALAE